MDANSQNQFPVKVTRRGRLRAKLIRGPRPVTVEGAVDTELEVLDHLGNIQIIHVREDMTKVQRAMDRERIPGHSGEKYYNLLLLLQTLERIEEALEESMGHGVDVAANFTGEDGSPVARLQAFSRQFGLPYEEQLKLAAKQIEEERREEERPQLSEGQTSRRLDSIPARIPAHVNSHGLVSRQLPPGVTSDDSSPGVPNSHNPSPAAPAGGSTPESFPERKALASQWGVEEYIKRRNPRPPFRLKDDWEIAREAVNKFFPLLKLKERARLIDTLRKTLTARVAKKLRSRQGM